MSDAIERVQERVGKRLEGLSKDRVVDGIPVPVVKMGTGTNVQIF